MNKQQHSRCAQAHCTWRKAVNDAHQVVNVTLLLRLPGGAGQLVRHPLNEQRAAVVPGRVLHPAERAWARATRRHAA